MFYFTLRYITRYSITFCIALHHTHVQVRADFCVTMQVDEFKSCDTNMPSTRCHQASHTHTHGEMGATRILKDFITLIPTVSYKTTHGRTLQNENAGCLKSR